MDAAPGPQQVNNAPATPSLPRAVGASVRSSPLAWIVGGLVVIALLTVGAVFLIGITAVATSRGRGGSAAKYVAPLPLAPIKLTVRKAALGEGYVVGFYNDSERYLKFTYTHKRPTLNQASRFTMALEHGQSKEIGWAEKEVFYPGDVVVIEHPDFQSKEWLINP